MFVLLLCGKIRPFFFYSCLIIFVLFCLAVDVVEQREEQILNCSMPDSEDGVTYVNQDEEPVAMVEELPADLGFNLNQQCMSVFSYFCWIRISVRS